MKKIMLGILGALILGIGSCAYLMFHVENGINLPHVSWLPSSATNVTYSKNELEQEYKFTIPESDLVQFAKEKELTIKEIDPELPETVNFFRLHKLLNIPSRPVPSVEIKHGFVCEKIQTNNGGIRLFYDRDTKTAYYHYSRN